MGWVGKIIADPASWFVTLNVERENYFIFSIYTIPGMDCDRKLFGIATIIFPINSCNPAYSN
jgi:hypothetical protein